MMNRIITAVTVFVCTATIALAQGGQGQQGPPPRDGHKQGRPGMDMGMRFFQGIDLTDAQKTQIKAINDKYREENQEQRKAAMEAMQKARQSNDTAAMRAAMQQMSAIYTGEQEREILAVLTPEQRDRYNKNKEEMKTKMKEHGKDRRGGEGRGAFRGSGEKHPQNSRE